MNWKRNLILVVIAFALAVAPLPAGAAGAPAAVWITLGTGGGPFVRADRSEPANALIIGKAIYLFDVGNGVLRQMAAAHLDLHNVRAVFISHQHIDHNADIGVLAINRWLSNIYAPLPVIGAPGTVSLLHDVLGYHVTELAPITVGGPAKPSIASTIRAKDIAAFTKAPVLVYHDTNIKVWAITNAHYHFPSGSAAQKFSRSYSFRIETPGRTIVYTGDTGPSKNVQTLATDANLLVSEVIDVDMIVAKMTAAKFPPAVLNGKIRHMREDHLTPVEVGKLAAAANVKRWFSHLVFGDDDEITFRLLKGITDYFMGRFIRPRSRPLLKCSLSGVLLLSASGPFGITSPQNLLGAPWNRSCSNDVRVELHL